MKRDFNTWLKTMRDSIATYKYYTDFSKVYKNVDNIKIELNILNSLIGSSNIKNEFISLYNKYPEIIKAIPILLAKRENEIKVTDIGEELIFNFKNPNYSIDEYAKFMEETGLFDLLEKHLINNLYDYVLGVECGLNSNARKNRGGHLMENLVEKFIQRAGFTKDKTYFKEMYLQDIERRWKLDMSFISNKNQATKRFDFVIKTDKCIYGIETNFYASGGSKLNEVARSYTEVGPKVNSVEGFEFVWITDGVGWKGAKNKLEEAFYSIPNIFNLTSLNDFIKMIKALDYLAHGISEDTRLVVIAIGMNGINPEIVPHGIEKGVALAEVRLEIHQDDRGRTRHVPPAYLDPQMIHLLSVPFPISEQSNLFLKVGNDRIRPHVWAYEDHFIVENLLKRMRLGRKNGINSTHFITNLPATFKEKLWRL